MIREGESHGDSCVQLAFQASRKVVSDGGGVALLREADRALAASGGLMTTGARSASSIRCSGWSPGGCSAARWVTKISMITTSFGMTVCRTPAGDNLTGERRVRERDRPLAG